MGRFAFLKHRVPSTRAWAAPLVFLALALAFPTGAHADKAKAAAHFKQGKAFFEAKQYVQAIAEYKAAYDIDKLPAHLYNIARAYHLADDFAAAIKHYQKFLDADPASPNAANARKEIVEATQQRDSAEAKRKADEAAKKLQDQRAAVESRVKQAKAYEQAGAWASAAEEYAAAGEHDPEQFLVAADAYRKVPDLAKARFAYVTYLDRVPSGARADQVRKDLATITKQLEVAALPIKKPDGPVDKPESPVVVPFHRGVSRYGVRAAIVASQGDYNAAKDQFKTSEGLVLGFGFDAGIFAVYAVTERIAIRPEVTAGQRRASFDEDMFESAVDLSRTGVFVGVVGLFALNRGETKVQLLAGLDLGFWLASTLTVNNGDTIPTDKFNVFDPVGSLGMLIDFGSRASFDIRYRRHAAATAPTFGSALQSLSLGLSLSFR